MQRLSVDDSVRSLVFSPKRKNQSPTAVDIIRRERQSKSKLDMFNKHITSIKRVEKQIQSRTSLGMHSPMKPSLQSMRPSLKLADAYRTPGSTVKHSIFSPKSLYQNTPQAKTVTIQEPNQVVKGTTTPINLAEFEIVSPSVQRRVEVPNETRELSLAQILKVKREGRHFESGEQAELPKHLRTRFAH